MMEPLSLEQLARRVRCPRCGGVGIILDVTAEGTLQRDCETCRGAGVINGLPPPDNSVQQLTNAAAIDARSEAVIEAECTKILEEDGWRALRTDPVSDRGRGKGFGELGMADHLYIRYDIPTREWGVPFPGAAEVLWIEYKSRGGKPKAHQLEWQRNERARGALVWCAGVDFPASVEGFVAQYRASGLSRRG